MLKPQSRVAAESTTSSACYAGHTCYGSGEGADAEGNGGSRDAYGYGEYAGQFKWWNAADLGANPAGTASASQLSYRTFSSGGFVSLFMPFFSETLLPDQEGTWDEVIDHRLHEATPTNGKLPTYYCARASFNGHKITQRCNPSPSANNAVARNMMTEMLDSMKKGHWIDHRTRLITISMQMRNNNAGVRFVARYMFEITQMGAVLPSYDMETLVDDDQNTETQKLWMTISLGLTIWFAFLEAVELLQSGPSSYFTNAWNIMDWTNFALFAICYVTLQRTISLNERDKLPRSHPSNPCTAQICTQFGYYDLWEVFDTAKTAKFFMSICVCIQLLKVIKFTNVIVPKMSLMTRVLAKGCYDLLFFGIIFAISMFAFCMLFFIQLGSFMDDFYSQTSSFSALAKALFGDFPFDEIIDNSRGYLNGILFLVYLFVAVFILLSMFLAILGEAQAAVRDDENGQKERGEFPNQYGFLGEAHSYVEGKMARIRRKSGKSEDDEEARLAQEEEEQRRRQEENPGIDVALNRALQRMQKKLDSSVMQRMTSLEQRVVGRLSGLETRFDTTGKTGGGGGGERSRRPIDSEGYDTSTGRRDGDNSRSSERTRSQSPDRIVHQVRGDHSRNEMKLADDRGGTHGRSRRSSIAEAPAGDSRTHSRSQNSRERNGERNGAMRRSRDLPGASVNGGAGVSPDLAC